MRKEGRDKLDRGKMEVKVGVGVWYGMVWYGKGMGWREDQVGEGSENEGSGNGHGKGMDMTWQAELSRNV